MASLAEIRAALAAQVAAAIPELTAYPYMPSAPDVPAVAVLPKSWRYDETFDAKVTWQLELCIYLNGANLEAAQQEMDAYLAPTGAQSVNDAVNDIPTLGLSGVSASAQGANEYAQLVDVAGGKLLLGRVNVEVLA